MNISSNDFFMLLKESLPKSFIGFGNTVISFPNDFFDKSFPIQLFNAYLKDSLPKNIKHKIDMSLSLPVVTFVNTDTLQIFEYYLNYQSEQNVISLFKKA
jgi:hypothetical protein